MAQAYQKHQRQPRESYYGQVSLFLTACIQDNEEFFLSNDIVNPLVEILKQAVTKNNCIVPVYCFMPEHLHIIIQGQADDSDTYSAMIDFKQKSGSWIHRHHFQSRRTLIFDVLAR